MYFGRKARKGPLQVPTWMTLVRERGAAALVTPLFESGEKFESSVGGLPFSGSISDAIDEKKTLVME